MTGEEHVAKARECVALAQRYLDNDHAAEANAYALLGICHLKLARYGEPSTRPFGSKDPGTVTRRWQDGTSGRVKVLFAVLRGATSHGDIMVATGFNKSTIHAHLVKLRRMGLVDWEPASQGTIRPTCRVVPHG